MVKTSYFCYNVYNYYLIIHSGLKCFYIYLNYNESEAFHIQLTSTLKNKVDVTQDRTLQEHFCFPAFAQVWMEVNGLYLDMFSKYIILLSQKIKEDVIPQDNVTHSQHREPVMTHDYNNAQEIKKLSEHLFL